jgi:putative ABC transport system permease protein
MRTLRRLTSVWTTVFRRSHLDRDLDDEIRATIETLTHRYAAEGMSLDAARRAAVDDLGGTAGIIQVRENVRDGRLGAVLESMLIDLRYAWRGLRRAPGLTAVIVATLALGIGANTAIFSSVYAMLIAPLPYPHADRLAIIWLDKGQAGYPRSPLSGPDLKDLRDGSRAFDAFGGIWASGTRALTGDGPPAQLRGALVTHNFFDVLGARAAIGRTFRETDGIDGSPPTVLLGWELFERRFNADPSIVGRAIVIDDQRTTVIGVMPRSFRLLLPPDSSVPDDLQIWQPFWSGVVEQPRGNLFMRVVGRMRNGVTLDEARADVESVGRRIRDDLGEGQAFTTAALHADGVRDIRAPLLALFAGVGILLTIACVNVASLLIARAVSRSRETALRLALGASRRRLLRQSLIEGLLLTGIGAAAGVLVGGAALRALVALAPESLSRIAAARIDATVLAFTLGLSLAWGVLLSFAPAAALFTSRAPSALARRPLRYHTRATLIVTQIAMSVVLLVCAGLLVRAFIRVQQVDPGFHADGRVVFRVALSESRYTTPEALVAASNDVRRRLAAIPGVTAVGAISHLPYDDLPNWYLTYAGIGSRTAGVVARADARAMSPGLFETLDVQLVDGRTFHRVDDVRRPVAIVDEMLAGRLWPGRSAVGQEFLAGQGEPDLRVTVVGVVRHLRLRSLVDDLTPQIFVPYEQIQRSPMTYVVKTPREPLALAGDIRAAIASFDPDLPISNVRPLHDYVEGARSVRRFTMLLAVSFAACAVALTGVGVFGMLGYAVATRRREFGVRRALGADNLQVLREVLREGLSFAGAGCAAGLAAAAVASRFLEGQLYAVDPSDPVTYAASLAVVLAGAGLACWIPASRATAISPMEAVRNAEF